MAVTEERIKLKPEEFENYKKRIANLDKMIDNLAFYSILLLRDKGEDLVQFFNQMDDENYTEEEIVNEIIEEMGYDITQTTTEQFLANVPETYREYFSEITEQISQLQTFEELGDFFDKLSATAKMNEQIEKDKSEICNEISTYDLSLIPPEMYNDFEELDRINLENTGARLDFENFNPNVYAKGSIKGCELISFNDRNWVTPDAQKSHRTYDSFDSGNLSAEYFDKEQYQVILDYFSKEPQIQWFRYEFLLEDSDIQKDNIDFIKKYFSASDPSIKEYSISEMWRIMIPEAQMETSEYFDFVNSSIAARYTCDELLKEKMPNLIERYRNKDGSIFLESYSDGYLNEVFAKCSSNIQIKFFNQVKELFGENITQYQYKLLWSKCLLDTQNAEIPQLFEDYKDENGINIESLIDILKSDKKPISLFVPEQYRLDFLNSLIKKYNGEVTIDEDYDLDYASIFMSLEVKNILNDSNINSIVKAMPTLGEDLILRTYNSNSEMIRTYADQLITAMCEKALSSSKEEAEILMGKFEDVFAQDSLPSFYKLYKYFELVPNQDNAQFNKLDKDSNLSPSLINAEDDKLRKRIIFSDLMKISMNSNNKSFIQFIETLEKGNITYVNIMNGTTDIQDLSLQDLQTFESYIKTLHTLYQESDAYTIDKRSNKQISLTGDLRKDAENLGKRYSQDGKIMNLPDRVLATFIGPYQELFSGITTVSQMKEYIQRQTEQSNIKHKKLASEKIELHTGDLVKGISGGDSMKIFKSILEDGVRAGEFLGTDYHSDATPLDTDFGVFLDEQDTTSESQDLKTQMNSTKAYVYSPISIIVKYDSNKIEFTRANESLKSQIEIDENTSASKIKNRNEPSEISRRINTRANEEYSSPKYEAFNSNFVSSEHHYGIRTGIGSTDIDYIVVQNFDDRMGYELAMNGTYIPIVDFETQEILFTPEQYDKIRTQMRGLSYYNADKFQVADSAFVPSVSEIMEKIFPDGNPENSVSSIEASQKRTAIETAVQKAMQTIGLDVKNELSGDLSSGFVELIDTGSTGRGTNVPGSGDFDFTFKIDRAIKENSEKMKQLTDALKKELAHTTNDPESKLEYAGENFRYKQIAVEGLDEPVDIDITFMSKDERVKYSTDMSVRERLENIKKDDPQGYMATVSNIILAKQKLKENGLYKKSNSPGSSEYGGFGGVGVENWILQNEGSFIEAMQTFLEASKQAPSFEEFKKIYPIFDFGQNHMSGKYEHDSFIYGLTESGYTKMQEVFKQLVQELTPEKTTPFRESFMQDAEAIAESRKIGDLQKLSNEVTSSRNEATQTQDTTNPSLNDD